MYVLTSQFTRSHTLTIKTSYSAQVDTADRPYLCMDLSFCHQLLNEGFKVPDNAEITVVKRIKYKGNEVEAAWPLGAAINLLSGAL